MDSLSIAASQVPYYQPQGTQAQQAPAFAGGVQAAAYTPQASQVQESGGLSLGKLLAGTAAVVGTVAAVKTHKTNGLLKEIGKDGAKVAEGAEGALAKTHELSLVDTFVQNLNPLNWFSKDKEGIEKLATDAKVKAVGENGLYQSIDGDTLHIRNGNKFTEIKAKEPAKAPDAVVADAPPVVPPVTPPPVAPKAPVALSPEAKKALQEAENISKPAVINSENIATNIGIKAPSNSSAEEIAEIESNYGRLFDEQEINGLGNGDKLVINGQDSTVNNLWNKGLNSFDNDFLLSRDTHGLNKARTALHNTITLPGMTPSLVQKGLDANIFDYRNAENSEFLKAITNTEDPASLEVIKKHFGQLTGIGATTAA